MDVLNETLDKGLEYVVNTIAGRNKNYAAQSDLMNIVVNTQSKELGSFSF